MQEIYVLGGGIVKDVDGWRIPNLMEGDKHGPLGEIFRMEAAFYLWKHRKARIVVSGGQGQYKKDNSPSVSLVMKEWLIKKGVPEEYISEESSSNNTREQLNILKNIIKPGESIEIVTNNLHIPRVKIMIEMEEKLRQLSRSGSIELISAEDICLQYDTPRWKKIINAFYQDPRVIERIKKEEQGIKDLKLGKYKD
jgi:hypothetical protein